jgi:predicted nucleotidyltransferase
LRGEADAESDVDLFFDTDDWRFSLIELVWLRRIVSALLGAEADLITRDSLRPALRARIAASAERLF